MKKMRGVVNVSKASLKKWIKDNVIFNKAVPFISGLIGVNAWVEFTVVAILITRLTENWLHLPKAASVVNLQDGVSAFLVIVVAYASDAYVGPFKVVVCTAIAYIIGLFIFFVGAWRLQRIEIHLLYVGIIFIALGRAGRDIALKEFLADQFRGNGPVENDEETVERRRKVWWRSAYVVGVFLSLIFPINASWIELSKISTIAMAVAFAFFLGGFAFYDRRKPTRTTPHFTVLRVLYAAMTNRHPSDTSSGDDRIKNNIPTLRWLDKATIKVESSPSNPEQARTSRHCTVEEVEEVKILFTLVPLWTTFLVYGLLQATGNTFFFEQANYMDDHLGSISHVPVAIFALIMTSSSFIVSRICDYLFPSYWGTDKIPRHVMLTRIGIGLAISPVCCLVAWGVEHYRLRQYVKCDVFISVFWLIPQFVLLGFMEGLVFDGLEEFFYVHVPKSFKKYGPSFTQFAPNIGHFLALAFILIFHGLLNDDLNTSSLGTYYMMLGFVCFVNLLFYCYVATYYVKQLYLHPHEMEEPFKLQQSDEQLLELQQSQEQLPELQQSHGQPSEQQQPHEQVPEQQQSLEDNP